MCSSWSKRHSSPSNLLFSENLNFLVDRSKLNNSCFQKEPNKKKKKKNSFGYLKCSNPNTKTPSNADANFESTRLKTRLFSNTVSTNPI